MNLQQDWNDRTREFNIERRTALAHARIQCDAAKKAANAALESQTLSMRGPFDYETDRTIKEYRDKRAAEWDALVQQHFAKARADRDVAVMMAEEELDEVIEEWKARNAAWQAEFHATKEQRKYAESRARYWASPEGQNQILKEQEEDREHLAQMQADTDWLPYGVPPRNMCFWIWTPHGNHANEEQLRWWKAARQSAVDWWCTANPQDRAAIESPLPDLWDEIVRQRMDPRYVREDRAAWPAAL